MIYLARVTGAHYFPCIAGDAVLPELMRRAVLIDAIPSSCWPSPRRAHQQCHMAWLVATATRASSRQYGGEPIIAAAMSRLAAASRMWSSSVTTDASNFLRSAANRDRLLVDENRGSCRNHHYGRRRRRRHDNG